TTEVVAVKPFGTGVQPRQGEADQPDRPGDGPDEPDRHDVVHLPPPRADPRQGGGSHPHGLRAKPCHQAPPVPWYLRNARQNEGRRYRLDDPRPASATS